MIKRIFGLLLVLSVGLLGTQFTKLKTHMEVRADPLVALTTLTYTFNKLGYKMQIDSISTQESITRIEAVLIGIKPFNTAVLAEYFQENGIKLTYGRVSQGKLELGIDAISAVWNTQILSADEGLELQRSVTPYWLRVEAGQIINIQSPYGGQWYPDISVLDRSMRVLYTFRSEKSHDDLKFLLPAGAYYLKISNTNGMKALKEGMWIESMSEGR